MPNINAIARRIVARAREVEPIVTKCICQPPILGRVTGLAKVVKELDKVESKLRLTTKSRGNINDSLRYTIVFEDRDYHKGVYQFIRILRTKSINIKEIRRRNDWGKSTGYKGINSTFFKDGLMDESGSKLLSIEVQFHTPRSFEASQRIHGNYAVMRELDDNDEERARLNAIAISTFSEIQVVSLGGATGAEIESFEWGETYRGGSLLPARLAAPIAMRSVPPLRQQPPLQ